MPMDKLKAFESFVSVATRGSLTAAARAEGVAPAIMGRRLMRWKNTWASSYWCAPRGASA